MAKFEVTTSELKRAVSDLTSDNAEFKNRVSELQELQMELSSEWQGDANTAFTTAFNNDKSQWDTFASLVDQYIQALQAILNGNYETLQMPGILALIAAIVSIITKEAMYWYTRHYAKQIDSAALMADAWHHRSDAFSSIGALIGIAGSRMGFPIMDSIASLVIFVFIAKAAFDIFKDAMDKMVDHSCDENMEKAIYDCVISHEDVLGIDLLQSRIFGNKIYVDLEIELDASYTLEKAHRIAEDIHEDIEKNFPKVKHVMIHVNPK